MRMTSRRDVYKRQLLYGTGPVIGLVKKLGYLGEDGKILMRLEDENISASVQKSFTVPLGGEGMILVEYIRKRGTADISITKNGQEVAGMGIERPEHMDGASKTGAEPGKRGELKMCIRDRLWNTEWLEDFFNSDFSYSLRAVGSWGLVLTVMAETFFRRSRGGQRE